MPDDYWKKIGEEIEAAKKLGVVVCPDCGAFKSIDRECTECVTAICIRCKHKFLNDKKDHKGRGRRLCPDCIGDRGGDRSPLPGDRLGGGMTTQD